MPEGNFEYLEKQGIEFSDLEKYEDALTCFEKAIELSSNNNDLSDAWTEKGFVKEKLKDFDSAIFCQTKAIEFNPKNADAWYMKGVSFGKQKKYVDEIICYQKALDINPNDLQFLDNMGTSLYNLGDFKNAITYFDRSISIDPNQCHPWQMKVIALKELAIMAAPVAAATLSDEAERCNDMAKKLGA